MQKSSCSANSSRVLVVVFYILSGFAYCSAEPLTTSSSDFKTYAAQWVNALSALKTKGIAMKGKLTITSSDAHVKLLGSPKVAQLNFSIKARGDKLVEVMEPIAEAEKFYSAKTYYLDSTQVIVMEKCGDASIFKLGKEPNNGLFNFCPLFLEYSFLNGPIGHYGIPALLPGDVISEEKWKNAIKMLDASFLEKNGVKYASKSEKDGFYTVDLIQGICQVHSISYFTKEKTIARKVEVIDHFQSKDIGCIGKAFKVSVFASGNEATPSVTWEFVITDIQLSEKIDEESLTFDPAFAAGIYDAENKTYIEIPK